MRTLMAFVVAVVLVPGVADARKTRKEKATAGKQPAAAGAGPAAPAVAPAAAAAPQPSASSSAPAAGGDGDGDGDGDSAAAKPASTETPAATSSKNSGNEEASSPEPPGQFGGKSSLSGGPRSAVDTSAEAASSHSATAGGGTTWDLAVRPVVGVIIPTSKLGSFVIGGFDIGYTLPVLDRHLVAALGFTYSRPGTSRKVNDARIGGEQEFAINTHQLEIALTAAYRLPVLLDGVLAPYVGLGPVVLMQRSVESATFIPTVHAEQSTNFGVELVGGADYRIGPGFAVAELRARYATLDQKITGPSNAGGMALLLGYRIGLSLGAL